MYSRTCRRLPAASTPVGKVFLLLMGATWLSGCAQQAKVTGAWQDNVPRNQAFSRILVVGVSPDVNQRCAFEYFLASQIKSGSTTAIASCDAVKQKEPLTRESIEVAVASQKADAVLATTLVAKKMHMDEGGERDTRGGGYYKPTGIGYETTYTGAYGVPVIYGEYQTAPSITTLKGDVRVETKLFETRGATLVYKLDTVAKDLESREEALAAISVPIAERLRRDGVIR